MMTRLKATLLTFSAALMPLPALAQAPVDRPANWHSDWGWGHMFFGSLMMILFWGGLILVIVLAVRWLGSGSAQGYGSQPPGKRPLDILQERFAHGEIDQEEFENRKRLLSD